MAKKNSFKINRICLSPGTLSTGGIGRNTLNLAKTFLDKGYEVDLVLTGKEQGLRRKEIPDGTHVVQLAERSRYALPRTVSYLRKRKPDLVITAHNNVNALMIIAHRLSGLGKQCRIVCTFRTYRSIQLQNSSWRGRLYDWLAFRVYRWADKLVAVSQGVANDIEESTELPKGTINVIYNPAWSEEMAAKAKEPCHDPWTADRSTPLIISAGRLSKPKDFPTLLNAFANLRKAIPARLIILGEGEDRKELENLTKQLDLADHVRLTGHVSNPLSYFSNADLFVLSSEWEGFGNVLVEALECGLPVVSTNCPAGPREILADGKYGELVPVKDSKELAEAMRRTLQSPPSPEHQKEGAQRFTFERSANKYLALFDKYTVK
jgi:glycosyltransferase involved in cell wall biosynthesis